MSTRFIYAENAKTFEAEVDENDNDIVVEGIDDSGSFRGIREGNVNNSARSNKSNGQSKAHKSQTDANYLLRDEWLNNDSRSSGTLNNSTSSIN